MVALEEAHREMMKTMHSLSETWSHVSCAKAIDETSRDAVYWTCLHESMVSHQFEHDFEQILCGDANLTSGDQPSKAIPVHEHDDDEITLLFKDLDTFGAATSSRPDVPRRVVSWRYRGGNPYYNC